MQIQCRVMGSRSAASFSWLRWPSFVIYLLFRYLTVTVNESHEICTCSSNPTHLTVAVTSQFRYETHMIFSDLDHLLTYIVLGTAAGRCARPSVSEDKKTPPKSVLTINSAADTAKKDPQCVTFFFFKHIFLLCCLKLFLSSHLYLYTCRSH